nr:DNA helicase [Tanacetum cinerariifolium]
MKTKRKLVPNFYPLTGDDNIVSFNIDHHVYDVNLNMSPKKQCLGGPSFISSPTVDVSPSGIWNMTPSSGTTILNRDIDRAIATLHQNDAVFVPFVECETPSHSVIPTAIRRESCSSRHRTKHNRPVTGGSSSQQPSSSDGEPPRSLQLYIYDTDNEVDSRLSHYGRDNSVLRRDIIEGLIDLLDTHNALVQLFRTAREKFEDTHIPNFKVKLYNVVTTKEYELPTEDMLGVIIYEVGPESDMDYDIV